MQSLTPKESIARPQNTAPANKVNAQASVTSSLAPLTIAPMSDDPQTIFNTAQASSDAYTAIQLFGRLIDNPDCPNDIRINSLLYRSQRLSSTNDYTRAIEDLRQWLEATAPDEPTDDRNRNNIAHQYIQLAFMLVRKGRIEEAQANLNRAELFNPQNANIPQLRKRIEEQTREKPDEAEKQEDDLEKDSTLTDEMGEFVLEVSDSVSQMLVLDIRDHAFSDEAVLSNGGVPTQIMAQRLLKNAKNQKDVDYSVRFPLYLEAAKAYSMLPKGTYDESKEIEALAYYANFKGSYQHKRFSELKDKTTADDPALCRLKDSVCDYYVEALNLLAKLKGNQLGTFITILRNYLKLNIDYWRKGQDLPAVAGNVESIFLSSIRKINDASDTTAFHEEAAIALRTLYALGTAGGPAWNMLARERKNNLIRLFFREMMNDFFCKKAYRFLNETTFGTDTQRYVDETLRPGEFMREIFSARRAAIVTFSTKLATFAESRFDLRDIENLRKEWNELEPHFRLLNDTDTASRKVLEETLNVLTPYLNRNSQERTNLLVRAQRMLDKQKRLILQYTTQYGRTFFLPLFEKWHNTLQDVLDKKINETQPMLRVFPDPPYFNVHSDGSTSVSIVIRNEGESTAEGFLIIPSFTPTDGEGNSTQAQAKAYDTELPAGLNTSIEMSLPAYALGMKAINMEIESEAKYQGQYVNKRKSRFTVEVMPDTPTFNDREIPWAFGPEVANPNMFKGRDAVIEQLSSHYLSVDRHQSYILYGLTRTGKSSILKYLGRQINGKDIDNDTHSKTATFRWNFSTASAYGNAPDMWYELLYQDIYEVLCGNVPKGDPEYSGWVDQEALAALRFSDNPRWKDFGILLDFMHTQNIYPLFLVDEFSYIKPMIDSQLVNPAWLHTLREISLQGKASFVFAGTYEIHDLLKDELYGITGQLVNSIDMQIAEIEREPAEDLMCAMRPKVEFTKEAMELIHRLSGDIPYFIQIICKHCAMYARDTMRSVLGYPEVDDVSRILTGEKRELNRDVSFKPLVVDVFQNNMYETATKDSKAKERNALISSLAYFNRDNRHNPRGVSMSELEVLWAARGIEDFRPKLSEALETLLQKKIICSEMDENMPVYRLTVDLFRRWWFVNHNDISLELNSIQK